MPGLARALLAGSAAVAAAVASSAGAAAGWRERRDVGAWAAAGGGAKAVNSGGVKGQLKLSQLHRNSFFTVQAARTASSAHWEQEVEAEERLAEQEIRQVEQAVTEAASLLDVGRLRQALDGKPRNRTALTAELQTLRRLYSHLKMSIVSAKRSDTSVKEQSKESLQVLEQKLRDSQAELSTKGARSPKPWKVSLLKERITSLNKQLKYWRDSSVGMKDEFRAELKTTHGLMSRVQAAMSAYSEVLSGKALRPGELDKLGHLPTPREALSQLQTGLTEYRRWVAEVRRHRSAL